MSLWCNCVVPLRSSAGFGPVYEGPYLICANPLCRRPIRNRVRIVGAIPFIGRKRRTPDAAHSGDQQ